MSNLINTLFPSSVSKPVIAHAGGAASTVRTMDGEMTVAAGNTSEAAVAHAATAENAASQEEINKAVSDVSKYIQGMNRQLNFSVEKDLGRTIIKIIDPSTEQVIKQIPSEEMINIAKEISGYLESTSNTAGNEGVLLRERA